LCASSWLSASDGVLTHLDKYVKLKKKQSIVYHVKHRFWKEIYSGAKLFVLKGIDNKTDYYYKSDITNLVRFISVLKFRPLTWRNSHSYLLCDRYEDLTDPALIHKYGKKQTLRTIAFYGYVRGCNLRQKQNVHVCGIGDFSIKQIQEMEDPVPTKKTQKKSSTLRVLQKNGKVYAPMANLGPVVFDKHAAYITVRGDAETAKKEDLKKHSWETEELYIKRLKKESLESNDSQKLIDIKQGDGQSMIHKLRDKYHGIGIDEKMKRSELRIFEGSKALNATDIERFEMEQKLKQIEIEKVGNNINVETTKDLNTNRVRRRVRFDDEVKNNKDGKIELNENAMEWNENEDDQEIMDQMEINHNFDFNADLNEKNENLEDEDVQKWIEEEKDDDDDIDLNENEKNNQQNTKKRDFWNEAWLNTPKERERKRLEVQKERKKMHQQNVSKRGLSSSLNESNVRWKQNLLSNASKIWHKNTTLFEHIYGEKMEEKLN